MKRYLISRLETDSIRGADVAVALGLEIEHYIREMRPELPVKTIFNGVDTTLFRHTPLPPREDRLILGFAGSFTWTHWREEWVEFIAELDQRRVPFLLHFIGMGPHLQFLQESLANRSDVIFHGHKKQDEVVQILRKADILLVPLRKGCIGPSMKTQEAVALGRPVVITNYSGTEFIERNGLGVVCPADDPGTFAEAVRQLAGDEKRRLQMNQNSLGYAERHFSWDRAVEAQLRFMEDAIRTFKERG
jgi:glycosyltransferase involved in cell wall biosynthesis